MKKQYLTILVLSLLAVVSIAVVGFWFFTSASRQSSETSPIEDTNTQQVSFRPHSTSSVQAPHSEVETRLPDGQGSLTPSSQQEPTSTQPNSIEEISFEELMDTSTWKTYENEDLGISFRYPVALTLVEENRSPGEHIEGIGYHFSFYDNDKSRIFLSLIVNNEYYKMGPSLPYIHMVGDMIDDINFQQDELTERLTNSGKLPYFSIESILSMNEFYDVKYNSASFGSENIYLEGRLIFKQRKDHYLMNISISPYGLLEYDDKKVYEFLNLFTQDIVI